MTQELNDLDQTICNTVGAFDPNMIYQMHQR